VREREGYSWLIAASIYTDLPTLSPSISTVIQLVACVRSESHGLQDGSCGKHVTIPVGNNTALKNFIIFKQVVLRNQIFWDVALCGLFPEVWKESGPSSSGLKQYYFKN